MIEDREKSNEEVFGSKAYRQEWENLNLTAKDFLEWSKEGFKKEQYRLVFRLKKASYSPEDLSTISEVIDKLRYFESQVWLDIVYPFNKRQKVKKISTEEWGVKIKGKLRISDFSNCKEVNLNDNKLIKISISNFPQMINFSCSNNQLTEVSILNCPQLKSFSCSDNQLIDVPDNLPKSLTKLDLERNQLTGGFLVFSHLINLEILKLGHNELEGSSLKILKKMKKLDLDELELEYNNIAIDELDCLEDSDSAESDDSEEINYPKREIKESNNEFEENGLVFSLRQQIEKKESEIKSLTKENQNLQNFLDKKEKTLVSLEQNLQTENKKLIQENKELKSQLAKQSASQIFYKKFFNNFLNNQKKSLNEWKKKLTDESQLWWDILIEAQEESERSIFAQKQIKRAREKLSKELNDKKIDEYLAKFQQISTWERQEEELSVDSRQELVSQVEVSPPPYNQKN